MPDFKAKYPAASSQALTVTLNGLASNASNVFTFGRESTQVDNTTNLDLDHLLSAKIVTGTSPTSGRSIAVYVYAPLWVNAGVPVYPDVFDGTDSDETITSAGVMNGMLRLAWSCQIEAATNRPYFMPPTSVAGLFNGTLPPFWGAFVAHDTGVNLGTGNEMYYHRIQMQSVG